MAAGLVYNSRYQVEEAIGVKWGLLVHLITLVP